ncbi:MAG: hydroxypyruvate isomerase [Pedosphaera sp. Tous-C6FEB]|nr:MAG: hydroxypyruvate isomerase [Pedosphaera sp. Tous-C6FEB]
MHPLSNRRSALTHLAAVTATAAALGQRLAAADAEAKVKINHSVCKWCYPKVSLDDLCTAGKQFGLQSVELLDPPDFATVKKHGLHCAMVSFPQKNGIGTIAKAFNRLEHHDTLVEIYTERLKQCADAGFKQLICFSGNRAGLDDETGLKNCATGLKRILPLAEKHGITLVMELLNSRVNHKDYQCDKSAWGVALCQAIGSERFKLLYDIYHMQIMEGDVIATIKARHQYFAHYHTGGVPGRNEIDDTQELNYPAIMRAIQATGYKGYVGQEFIPKRDDKIASLKQGVQICTV